MEVPEEVRDSYIADYKSGSKMASLYTDFLKGSQVSEARKAMAQGSRKGLENEVKNLYSE